MRLGHFKGGIHPFSAKKYTIENKIIDLAIPNRVYIPLLQHIGAVLDPLVKIGETVKIGQKIGDSKALFSVPIHSSVSGKVIAIKKHVFPVNGIVNTVIIENNREEEWVDFVSCKNFKSKSKEEIVKIIRENGVVGKGGATFPTHIKLTPPKGVTIDTLVINGAECEPYLNADYRHMMEYSKEIIKGIEILIYVLGINKAVVGVENNKPKAIEILKKLTESNGQIEIISLHTKYPQGGEKQLIKSLLNRDVPTKKLPSDVGVVVQNIVTAKIIYDAVCLGRPLIDTIVTVAGQSVDTPQNLRVRIGTRFKHLLNASKVNRDKMVKLVMGGPMMGLAQYTEDTPVVKGTTGLLALTKYEVNDKPVKACINCAKCISVCPMHLHPLEFVRFASKEKWDMMEQYLLLDCIDCGSCAYICPANRPLIESIKLGKTKLREIARKEVKK